MNPLSAIHLYASAPISALQVLRATREANVGLLGCNSCGFVGRYLHFEQTYCLHLQSSMDGDNMFLVEYTWHYNPEDYDQHLHHHENLKSHTREAFYPQLRPIRLFN
jgi:hypothetical protein